MTHEERLIKDNWCVYVIHCENNHHYVGISKERWIKLRLEEEMYDSGHYPCAQWLKDKKRVSCEVVGKIINQTYYEAEKAENLYAEFLRVADRKAIVSTGK